MSEDLDSIVEVTITKETTFPSRSGFGTPLIAAYHTAWADRVKEYSKPGEMLDDGFTTSSAAYKAAVRIKGQKPSPRTFKIGRRSAAITKVFWLVPRITTVGFVYSGTIKGQTFSYTVVADDTVALIADALVTLIDAFTGVAATDGTTHVVVTGTSGDIFEVDVVKGLDILDKSTMTKTVHLVPTDTTSGLNYAGTLGGQAYTYVVQPADTVALIVDGLVADLNGIVTGVTCTDSTTHAVLTGPASVIATFTGIDELTVTDPGTTPTLTDDLEAIIAEDNNWFGLLLDSNSRDEILLAAEWTEAQKKIFCAESSDWDIRDADEDDDIASELKSRAYMNTFGIYNLEVGEWAAVAWLGHLLTYAPGSATGAYKTLRGVTTDNLTTSEKAAIEGKYWSHFTVIGGKNVTFEGKVGDGDFIDITIGLHWLHARIQERVFAALSTPDKLDYTDAGIDAIAGEIRAVLKQACERPYRFLDRGDGSAENPGPSVSVPKLVDIDPADRAARLVPDISFDGRVVGAIHKARIAGTVSV